MYLKIDEAFTRHIKTQHFCGLLGKRHAWAHLQCLWAWACRGTKNGDLTRMSVVQLEVVMEWEALDGKCYQAAVDAGFIDELPDGRRVIHNWEKRTGGSIAEMESDVERKRARRRHDAGKCEPATCPHCAKGLKPVCPPDKTRTTGGTNPDDRRDKPGRPPLDQDRTGQDRTESFSEALATPEVPDEPGEQARSPGSCATVYGLQWAFRIRWEAKRNQTYRGDHFFPKGAREFLERLTDLGPDGFADAVSKIPAALDAYFALNEPGLVKHAYPAKFFAERFSALAGSGVGNAPMATAADRLNARLLEKYGP